MKSIVALSICVAATCALPTRNADLGVLHGAKPDLHSLWVRSGVKNDLRYNPITDNQYHLYTRFNPTNSQPLLINNDILLSLTNYDASRRTVILVHGWLQSITSDFNTVLVPAFLERSDANVIVVDWSSGSNSLSTFTANWNTEVSAPAVAAFIRWLVFTTNGDLDRFHIIGFGMGAHQAGIIGRNLGGEVGYITALDPNQLGWTLNENRFHQDDAKYTEVIHTSAGLTGYISDLGHADFYPNGGAEMPGCESNDCHHARSFYYLAESLTSAFTGRACVSYVTALASSCILPGTLQMGGLFPKTGFRVPPVAPQMGYGPGEAMNTSAENHVHAYMGHCRRCYVGLRNLFRLRLKDPGSKEVDRVGCIT